jgi:hypothetical protein
METGVPSWASSWPTAAFTAAPPAMQPVAYSFEAMPEDPDAQVHGSVRRMVALALRDASSPEIQRKSAEICGNPIEGLWRQTRPMKFTQDYDTAQWLQVDDPRKSSIVETFIPPSQQAKLLDHGIGYEDCDGFSMYGAAVLTALVIPCSFCTVSAERDRPEEFTHVYLVAYLNGRRIPLDLSHGPHPGWECPNLGRVREWPVCIDTLRPSLIVPLILVAGAAGYLLWRGK